MVKYENLLIMKINNKTLFFTIFFIFYLKINNDGNNYINK